MYEIGRIYLWQNQAGRFSYLNGTETTVTGPPEVYASVVTGRTTCGWPTDTAPPSGMDWIAYAEPGDLVPVDPPSGERSVMEMFRELEHA